jgi:hypothetical protein
MHSLKQKRKKLDYQVTSGIFLGYSIWTKQYFIYDSLTKTLHRSRNVVLRGIKWYPALNCADEEIMNEHCYRDIIQKPKSTPKQPTSDETS